MTMRNPPARVPTVVVFDVNETLSDLAPLRDAFATLGAPAATGDTWFAATLRDGFALTVTDEKPAFVELATDVARTLLAPYIHDVDAGAEEILRTFRNLAVHPDVVEGVQDLHTLHRRLVTLSNGAAAVADALLTRAGIRDSFEQLLTVDDAAHWKPAPEAYRYAAAACGVPVEECLLVACHPWDLHGASRAGMATAWVNRGDAPYPRSFDEPGLEADSMVDLAAQLGAVGA
jgi:2-haloacid dehalogenase